MAIQLSTTLRTAMAEEVATALGANFTCEIRTGSPPANCAAADSGTLLATFNSCNWAAASGGAIALTGTPETTTGAATATAGHFRLKNGSTCHVQGTVGTSGADMTIDNASISTGQTVNLGSYTLTVPNS